MPEARSGNSSSTRGRRQANVRCGMRKRVKRLGTLEEESPPCIACKRAGEIVKLGPVDAAHHSGRRQSEGLIVFADVSRGVAPSRKRAFLAAVGQSNGKALAHVKKFQIFQVGLVTCRGPLTRTAILRLSMVRNVYHRLEGHMKLGGNSKTSANATWRRNSASHLDLDPTTQTRQKAAEDPLLAARRAFGNSTLAERIHPRDLGLDPWNSTGQRDIRISLGACYAKKPRNSPPFAILPWRFGPPGVNTSGLHLVNPVYCVPATVRAAT